MTMRGAARRGLVGALILVLAMPPGVLAQLAPSSPPPPAGVVAAATFRQEELDQLLAPIALYPDALLAQILMTATYPLEVVLAARWVREHPDVKGPHLEAVMLTQPWDPSVKSLTAFPQVLAMMDANLDWTQKLGDAFLAQQQDVMATIQTLRARAHAAGYLQSTPEQAVIVAPPVIRIEPATPQIVYVPIYDPVVVYGPWWYPAYPPYYWYPPGYVVGASVFSFSVGFVVGAALWGGFDWPRRHVTIVHVHHFHRFTRTRTTDRIWRHEVVHRRSVPYRDPGVRQRFGQGPLPGAAVREPFRGRVPEAPRQLAPPGVGRRPGVGSSRGVVARPQRVPAAPQVPRVTRPPAAFEAAGWGREIRGFSDRGRTSRMGTGAAVPEQFRGPAPEAARQLEPRSVGRHPGAASVPGVRRGPEGRPAVARVPRPPRPPAAFEGLGRGGETRGSSFRGRTSGLATGTTRPVPSTPRALAGGGRPGVGGGRLTWGASGMNSLTIGR